MESVDHLWTELIWFVFDDIQLLSVSLLLVGLDGGLLLIFALALLIILFDNLFTLRWCCSFIISF